MLCYIALAIIIIVAVACVYFISSRAYKRGVNEGRMQVLNEELIRLSHKKL